MSGNAVPPTDRWALLIGIDRYLHMQEWDLQGAVRDVDAFEKHLHRQWGFSPRHILKLTNAEANQEGIRNGMQWLEDKVASDDLTIVFYGGHGSWRPDSKTSKRRADGREKTLVPCDSGRKPLPNLDIGGDELHDWLQKLVRKTPYVTVILDCCHSGTLTRTSGPRQRGVEPDTGSAGFREAPDPAVHAPPPETSSGWFPMVDGYTLIAACRSDQTAVEIELDEKRGRQGVLTHFLLRSLEAASADTAYQDVVDSVTRDLETYFRGLPPSERDGPLQEPQLEGAWDRQVFGRREIPTLRYVKVVERLAEGEVRLAGGAVHRIRQGQEIDVYAGGTRRSASVAGDPGENEVSTRVYAPVGRVRITEVREVNCSARILTESEECPIQAGDRAVPQKWEDLQLVVRLEPAPLSRHEREVADLRACIEESPLMRLAEPEEKADLVVLILPPRKRAGKDDALPSLGRIEAATWVITQELTTLRAPLHPVREREAGDKVFRNLEKWARWQALFELENPGNPLTDKVDLVLLQRNQNDVWEPAAKDEDPVFRAGEQFAFRITNRYGASVFAYVLDLGFGGGIGPLYPMMTGAWEPLKPRRSVEVGIDREVGRFYSPRDYPYHPASKPRDGLEREVLKMIVTTEKTDFRIFFQEGYRDPGLLQPEHRQSELGRVLSFVTFGSPLRGEGEPEPLTDDEWTTVEWPLWVRP